MPRYDFTCHTCGRNFETSLPFGASQKGVRCPAGHRRVRRVYSPTAVVFNGPGFYRTDSRGGQTTGSQGSS
jgi:putative FmdB family regulatory protein